MTSSCRTQEPGAGSPRPSDHASDAVQRRFMFHDHEVNWYTYVKYIWCHSATLHGPEFWSACECLEVIQRARESLVVLDVTDMLVSVGVMQSKTCTEPSNGGRQLADLPVISPWIFPLLSTVWPLCFQTRTFFISLKASCRTTGGKTMMSECLQGQGVRNPFWPSIE